jgi:RecA/RadA recombinase
MINENMKIIEIPLRNGCINTLLSGGFKTNKLYHFFGKEGAGKSTMCLEIANLVASKGYKTLYIDSSKSFNLSRLEQIAGKSYDVNSKLIFIQSPKNFLDQDKIINKLENFVTDKFKLVIVDDIISLSQEKIRLNSKPYLKNRMISRQIALLRSIALNYDIIVIFTNQASEFNTEEEQKEENIVPFLKSVTTFYSDYDLEIRIPPEKSFSERILVRVKPSNLSELETCKYILSEDGIK